MKHRTQNTLGHLAAKEMNRGAGRVGVFIFRSTVCAYSCSIKKLQLQPSSTGGALPTRTKLSLHERPYIQTVVSEVRREAFRAYGGCCW